LPDVLRTDLLVFALVLARVGALVAVAPVFGAAAVPWRLRAGFAVLLALLIAPLEISKATSLPETLSTGVAQVAAEALVGLTLGVGVLVLFSAVQVAGQLISQASGMQLAEVFDPAFGAGVPVFSTLLFYITVAVVLSVGGHRHVLQALLDTFAWMPAGQADFAPSFADSMIDILAQSFELGIRAAAPVMVALLLAALVLGLVGRTLPQLNLLTLGFGLNVMAALAVLGVSLGAGAWVFQDQLLVALESMVNVLAKKP
jgi:flagellar biosynthetic protein FliR